MFPAPTTASPSADAADDESARVVNGNHFLAHATATSDAVRMVVRFKRESIAGATNDEDLGHASADLAALPVMTATFPRVATWF